MTRTQTSWCVLGLLGMQGFFNLFVPWSPVFYPLTLELEVKFTLSFQGLGTTLNH